MASSYLYPGEELELFEKAGKWKRYFAKTISKYISGDVLEVGAGKGETTIYLLNEKVSHWLCLEPDQNLCRVIDRKIEDGLLPSICNARCGDLSGIQAHSKYDTIIYIDVLEHIRLDREQFEEAASRLKDGGHIIVLAPAFNKIYSEFDKAIGHYRRYSKKTLRAACGSIYLNEIKMFYLESAGYFLLWLNKIFIRKKYPSAGDIRLWQNFFIPISRVLDKILFHRLGKSIVGIWQKA